MQRPVERVAEQAAHAIIDVAPAPHLERAPGLPGGVGELGDPAQAVPQVAGAEEGGATPGLVEAGQLPAAGVAVAPPDGAQGFGQQQAMGATAAQAEGPRRHQQPVAIVAEAHGARAVDRLGLDPEGAVVGHLDAVPEQAGPDHLKPASGGVGATPASSFADGGVRSRGHSEGCGHAWTGGSTGGR